MPGHHIQGNLTGVSAQAVAKPSDQNRTEDPWDTICRNVVEADLTTKLVKCSPAFCQPGTGGGSTMSTWDLQAREWNSPVCTVPERIIWNRLRVISNLACPVPECRGMSDNVFDDWAWGEGERARA